MPEFSIELPGHPDELFGKNRKFKVYYYIPDEGINKDTGIFGIHTSYCTDSSNPFYKKIRKIFSNDLNMIVFGTNYMGVEAFQSREITLKETLQQKIIIEEKYDEKIWYEKNDYNDFGLIQSLDICNSILYFIYNYKINTKRIYLSGSSLGGFVSQMVSKFLPKTIKAIVDISGLVYIEKNRIKNGNTCLIFDRSINNNPLILKNNLKDYYYMLNHTPYNKINLSGMDISEDMLQIRDLRIKSHYKHSEIKELLLTGVTDKLVPLQIKKEQLNTLISCGRQSFLLEINEKDVDGKIIKDTGHSLGANILYIFKQLFSEKEAIFSNNSGSIDENVEYVYPTKNGEYKLIVDKTVSLSFNFL